LKYWAAKFHRLTFEELNVTGRDTLPFAVPGGTYYDPQMECFGCYFKKVYALRQYQVFDENWRSVDIRLWEKEIEEVTKELNKPCQYRFQFTKDVPGYRKDPCGYGRKCHLSHTHLGPLWNSAIREADGDIFPEEDMGDYRPVIDRTKPRKRGIYAGEGYNRSDKLFAHKWHRSKCWKDQTHAERQWAKREPGCSKVALRRRQKLLNHLPEADEWQDLIEKEAPQTWNLLADRIFGMEASWTENT